MLACCQIPQCERKCWGAQEIFSCAASDLLSHWRVMGKPEVKFHTHHIVRIRWIEVLKSLPVCLSIRSPPMKCFGVMGHLRFAGDSPCGGFNLCFKLRDTPGGPYVIGCALGGRRDECKCHQRSSALDRSLVGRVGLAASCRQRASRSPTGRNSAIGNGTQHVSFSNHGHAVRKTADDGTRAQWGRRLRRRCFF